MKTKITLTGIAVFLCLSFDVPSVTAETAKIIISEIQITGGTGHTNDEFVELYNGGSNDQSLTNWELRKKTKGDKTANGTLFHKFEGNLTISIGQYFLWTNKESDAPFVDLFDVQSKNKTSPNLTDDNSFGLYDNTGILIDALTWGSGHSDPFSPSTLHPDNPPGKKSLTRNLETQSLSLSDKPTPTNSHGKTYTEPILLPPPSPLTYDTDIHINEILANPSGDEGENEFIELFNPSDTVVDLSSWSLKDASASGKYIFPDKTEMQPKSFLVISRSVFKFALNNSDETVSLLDPNGGEKDTVSYKTAKEDISWNHTATGFRGGTPTPGAPNRPNTLPQTREIVPKKGYRMVAIDFDARGGDTDRDTLKYTWDFGDGHKSYKENPTHTYEENGTYTVTLKVSDGKDDTEETFTLEIESYPHLDIRITSLLPNPSGSDTGNEWLLIENREKKSINLKGYSIAVGWKELSNHPIREDFLIGPKKEAKLTHDFSLFTLPNQKGKIELRAPDGKVLQDIKYKLDKPVAENAVYAKEKGSAWKWNILKEKTVIKKEKNPLVLGTSIIKLEGTLQPTEENAPLKTKSDQLSLDPDRPLLQEILAYGTRVQLPDAIALAFPSSEETNLTSLPEPSIPPSEESILSKINASLNEFLNTAE